MSKEIHPTQQAYADGVRDGKEAGAQAEREAILKIVEEICDQDVADAVTFGMYAKADDLLKELKQRLEGK